MAPKRQRGNDGTPGVPDIGGSPNLNRSNNNSSNALVPHNGNAMVQNNGGFNSVITASFFEGMSAEQRLQTIQFLAQQQSVQFQRNIDLYALTFVQQLLQQVDTREAANRLHIQGMSGTNA